MKFKAIKEQLEKELKEVEYQIQVMPNDYEDWFCYLDTLENYPLLFNLFCDE